MRSMLPFSLQASTAPIVTPVSPSNPFEDESTNPFEKEMDDETQQQSDTVTQVR